MTDELSRQAAQARDIINAARVALLDAERSHPAGHSTPRVYRYRYHAALRLHWPTISTYLERVLP